MKITIIGAGNMGGSIAVGLLNTKAFKVEDLTIVDINPAIQARFRELGVQNITNNATEGVMGADVVILAVKPWYVISVAREIASNACAHGGVVISVAADVPLSELEKVLTCPVVRVMPNMAVAINKSMSFMVGGVNSEPSDLDTVRKLFDQLGRTEQLQGEQMLDACMAVTSCGIAYALRYIRAAGEGGVELGIPAAKGYEIVAQTLIGAAELLLESGNHPEVEIDRVTTPGGITIKGLNTMEQNGFSNAIIQGLKASK